MTALLLAALLAQATPPAAAPPPPSSTSTAAPAPLSCYQVSCFWEVAQGRVSGKAQCAAPDHAVQELTLVNGNLSVTTCACCFKTPPAPPAAAPGSAAPAPAAHAPPPAPPPAK